MAFIFLLIYIIDIYIRPGDWIRAVYGWHFMEFTAICAIICLMFESGLSKKGFVKAPQNILILAFIGAIILSHLSHFYFGGAYYSFIEFSKIVILYFLIVNIIDSEKKFKITIILLVMLTMFMAIQGIEQYKTGIGLAGQTVDIDGRISWVGIFHDANDLALAFVMIVPFLISYIFRGRILLRLIALPLFGLLLYGIYLTNSRGGILALMVVIFSYFVVLFKKKWQQAVGAVVGTGLASLVFIFGPSRMAMLTPEESSAAGRIDAWYTGFQMFKSNPIFGVGKGMFTEDYHLVAHNSFIHCAAEMGLFGLFVWVALFYVSLKSLFSIQRDNGVTKEIKMHAQSLTIGFYGLLAAMFFLSRVYVELPYLLIALSAVLFNIAQKQDKNLKISFKFRDMMNVSFLCMGILALILIVVKVVL